MIQDKCEQLDAFNVGQELNISFNLKGRKWTDPQGNVKYFNTLQAWKLAAVHDLAPESNTAGSNEAMDSLTEPEWLQNDSNVEADDLPF